MSAPFTYSALPPLEWLRVFESAARRGNFSAAAEELGLTQAAVSQRIRKLEARLGTRLFDRLPRGVELTIDGEAYAPHVQSALAALQRSTADLFGKPRRRLTVAAPQSIIDLWIAPRLATILAAFPALEITFATFHRHTDAGAATADLWVRFGDGNWPGATARKMFDEVLAPVIAPGLLRSADGDWRTLPQIAVSGPRDGWREWAAATGVAPPKPHAVRFDSITHALSATLAGAGVMLGSLALLGPYLESDTLRRLDEPALKMEQGYWLTWKSNGAEPREFAGLADIVCAIG